jgi:hypothetical protein
MADNLQIISNDEMNKIVLQIFQLIGERNEKNILLHIKHYANFRNENGHSIFYFSNSQRNNILISSCNNGLTNVSIFVVRKYHDLFNLGLMDSQRMTALMICINKNMYLPAYELLNFPSSLPEITNESITNTALKLMLTKSIDNEYAITILVKIIRYYLQNNPNNPNFHQNINTICGNVLLAQELQKYFHKNEIDFERICLPVQEVTASDVVNAYAPRYETRRVSNNRLTAQNYNIPVAMPLNDMNFDANEYTDAELSNLRLQKRLGGKKRTRTNQKKQSARTNQKKRTKKRRGKYKKRS